MTVFSVEIVPKDPLWKIDLLTYIIGELGFSGVWLSEHPHNRSSFITASSLLNKASRVWVGLGVVNPYTINPFVIAQLAASLTEVAPNRIKIAIGAGDKTTLESIGIERIKPLEKIREAVTIIRQLLTKKKIATDRIHGRLDFNPRSSVPIYIGAQGPKMLQLGGEIGDGVLVNYSNPEDLEWAYNEVKKGIEKAGRKIENIDIAAYLTISLDEEPEKAVKTATPYAAYILCGLPEKIMEKIGVSEEKLIKVKEAIQKGDWLRLYDFMDVDIVKKLVIVGQPRILEEKLREIIDIGYSQIVIGAPIGPRILRTLREIKKTIDEAKTNLYI
jgi:5,10-methylenetetrahydromethanopterin reductase